MLQRSARHLILGERVILCRKTFSPTQGRMSQKGRESLFFREILSFSERFSPHVVEIQYIFYRVTFSPKQRESLYFRENLSF
jgi:hypothetical protein